MKSGVPGAIKPKMYPQSGYFLVYGYFKTSFTVITQGFLSSELFHTTSIALLGSSWVPKEAKNLKEHEFLGLSRCFSVRFEKSSKTSKIGPKRIEKRHFLVFFRSLFKFS